MINDQLLSYVKEARQNGIIIPEKKRPYPHLVVEEFKGSGPFLSGRIDLRSNSTELNYESDIFFDVSSGILPRDFKL